MTVCITVLATVVAIAAAARSTWSPCGLSMLSTITPVSERAKCNSYRSTATWFVVGATIGGATLGVVAAVLARGVRSLALSPSTVGLLALGAVLVAAGSDAGTGGFRLPIHRRQVNERWLDQFRPWVYGAGFGWQIGTGLTTYITTAAVYLMIVLGALTSDPSTALAVGTVFGALRGLAVLLAHRVTTPTELRAFHRRFHDAGPSVGRVTIVVEVCAAVVLVAYLRSPFAVAAVGIALGVTVVSVALARRRGLLSAPTCSPRSVSGSGRSAGVTAGTGLSRSG